MRSGRNDTVREDLSAPPENTRERFEDSHTSQNTAKDEAPRFADGPRWKSGGACDSARFDIANRRLAEESAVFPVELAGTLIADFEGGTCCIQTLIEHAFSGYMQSKLLLVLQGAHRGERTELVVQGRYAHPRHGREFLNAQGLSVVHPEPLDRLGRTVALLAECSDGAEMFPLRAAKQAEDDFTLDQTAEKWDVLWRVKKVDEPGTCVQEFE